MFKKVPKTRFCFAMLFLYEKCGNYNRDLFMCIKNRRQPVTVSRVDCCRKLQEQKIQRRLCVTIGIRTQTSRSAERIVRIKSHLAFGGMVYLWCFACVVPR